MRQRTRRPSDLWVSGRFCIGPRRQTDVAGLPGRPHIRPIFLAGYEGCLSARTFEAHLGRIFVTGH